MNYGGYHDWFLPSKNELNYVLYKNSIQQGGLLGGFQSFDYWSSTEGDASNAWIEDFINVPQLLNLKGQPQYVRCVRIY